MIRTAVPSQRDRIVTYLGAQTNTTVLQGILAPTQIGEENGTILIECPEVPTGFTAVASLIGQSNPIAGNLIIQAIHLHQRTWEANILMPNEVAGPECWLVDSTSQLLKLLHICEFLANGPDKEKEQLTVAQKFGLYFCELAGEPQRVIYGKIEFSPLLRLDESDAHFLSNLFADGSQTTLAELETFLQTQLRTSPAAHDAIPTAQPPSFPSTDIQQTTFKKKGKAGKLVLALIALALIGGIGSFYFQKEPSFKGITKNHDRPTALSILSESKGAERQKLVHHQYVTFFGQDSFSRLYQPVNADPEVSSIVVPVSHPTIKDAIFAAGSDSTVYIKPGAYSESFRLKRGVSLEGLNTVNGAPKVAIKAPSDSFTSIIRAESAGFLEIKNIIFDGNKVNREGVNRPVIDISNTTILMTNCKVTNAPSTGIKISSSGGSESKIAHTVVDSSDGNGIEIVNKARVGLSNVEASENRKNGLLANGGSELRINKSKFLGNQSYGIEFTYAAADRVTETDCVRNKIGGFGISDQSYIELIEDCNFSYNVSGDGAFVSRSVVDSIINLTVSNNESGTGLSLNGIAKDILVSGLVAKGNGRDGLFFQHLPSRVVFGNPKTVTITLSNSTLEGNKRYGVNLQGPGKITVQKVNSKSNLEKNFVKKNMLNDF